VDAVSPRLPAFIISLLSLLHYAYTHHPCPEGALLGSVVSHFGFLVSLKQKIEEEEITFLLEGTL
jgi:hypothetical protein